MSNLGDRIKRYENTHKYWLPPRQPLFIRVDGRAFHSFTRGLDKPFDLTFIEAMVGAATEVAKELMGFKLAYVQSDEATFMITDYDKPETQGWFDYELNKVVSISASLMTFHFNRLMTKTGRVAVFDSRAFTVPIDDAPNVFVWRQQDWERNSVSMLAQANFSHGELHKKGRSEMQAMLKTKGIEWTELDPLLKHGTFIRKVLVDEGLGKVSGSHPVEYIPVWRSRYLTDHLKADYNTITDWLTA